MQSVLSLKFDTVICNSLKFAIHFSNANNRKHQHLSSCNKFNKVMISSFFQKVQLFIKSFDVCCILYAKIIFASPLPSSAEKKKTLKDEQL